MTAGEASTLAGRPQRIVVLNQYYWPGVEATAHLLTELCEGLADEFDITVVTGMVRDARSLAGRSERNGVQVLRVPSTFFERRRLALRAVNYVSFLVQAFRAAYVGQKPDLVLCMTDPPLIGDVALFVARKFRVPLVVISQDVFPEAAVELRRLQNPVLIAALRGLIHYYLRRADCVVAIGDTMRARLEAKGASPERVRVITNWTDTRGLTPKPHGNEWAREQGLEGRFVVMHSGNIGWAQSLDALVRAATFLRDLDDLTILIIGEGARHADLVQLVRTLDVEAVRFLPYQPREVLSQSLSAAHVHVVGLARGLSGYVVPSRLYGVLAVGRPVIAAAEPSSETAQIVQRLGCGIVLPPGRPELLAAEIRRFRDGAYDLDDMGRRGREWVESQAGRDAAIGRYRSLVRELLAV